LATKVDEEKRRHRDILNVFDRILKTREAKGLMRIKNDFIILDPGGKRYRDWKANMMKLELALLSTLGYRLLLQHPQKFLLQYIAFFNCSGQSELTQKSWAYCNDSLRIPELAEAKPETIACAALHLAAEQTTSELPSAWYEDVGCELEEIEKLSKIIAEIYLLPKSKTSTYPEPHPDERHENIDKIKYPMPQVRPARKTAKEEKKKSKKSERTERKSPRERSKERRRRHSKDRSRKRRTKTETKKKAKIETKKKKVPTKKKRRRSHSRSRSKSRSRREKRVKKRSRDRKRRKKDSRR